MAAVPLSESRIRQGKSKYPSWARAQPHTHPKTPHFSYGTGSLSLRGRTWTFLAWEHNSAHEVHLCYWYNVLNYALLSFGQSDSEICTYQSAQGGGRDRETATAWPLCSNAGRVTNCRSLELGPLEIRFISFSWTLGISFLRSLKAILRLQSPSSHRRPSLGRLFILGLGRGGVGDYISHDAPRTNTGTRFPRIPRALALPDGLPSGVGDFGAKMATGTGSK